MKHHHTGRDSASCAYCVSGAASESLERYSAFMQLEEFEEVKQAIRKQWSRAHHSAMRRKYRELSYGEAHA